MGERGIWGNASPKGKEGIDSLSYVGGPRPYESVPSTLGSANARAWVVSDGVAWGIWLWAG